MNITNTNPPPKRPDTPGGPLKLRLAAIAGALIYAGLAIASGYDRLAFDRPALARKIPAPFAVNALAVASESRLVTDPKAAEALASELVARAPIEPASTALLGAARYATGDLPGADRAFRVAGQLGWRIPLTQAYWRQEALARGNFPVAAQRLDALLRQDPELLRDPKALAPFENDPNAQRAWVDRLATRPSWLGWYIGKDDQVPAEVLARRVPALILLAQRGIVLGCAAVAPAVVALTKAGMVGDAELLKRAHCRG